MTSVELRGIVQAFGGHGVLRELDLETGPGQYVVLLGPSGCGKTTTLRIIAGLQKPDRGQVLFDGRIVNDVVPRKRDVAMVFQHDGLYPHLTVEQSICFALKGEHRSAAIQSRLEEAVALTKIDGILDRYPNRLSGGELRRAAVAKAVARRSSIRLLDEPLSALDMPVRHALQDDILRWHSAVPGTTIHVTHDGNEAMRMADKIAVMEQGRIVQFATPHEIFARPSTILVAQSIGSPPINLLPARLSGGKIESSNSSVTTRIDDASRLSDRDVVIGVRPESFRLAGEIREGDAGTTAFTIEGKLLRQQSVGREAHLHLAVGDVSVDAVVPSESVSSDAFAAGGEAASTVRLCVAIFDVHVFDASSGCRIAIGG